MADSTSTTGSRDAVLSATDARQREMRPQSVPVKMYETPGALVVVAPFPAVTSDDVVIELRGETLRFAAALRSAPPRTYLLDEWEFGGYEREVTVPPGYGGALEATLQNGQLAIRVTPGTADTPITIHPS